MLLRLPNHRFHSKETYSDKDRKAKHAYSLANGSEILMQCFQNEVRRIFFQTMLFSFETT